MQWTNWAGHISCLPHTLSTPRSEAELVALIGDARRAHAQIRVVGSGHSFVPLCATDGLLLSLDGLQGVIATDAASQQATVWAGSKIWQLGDPLWNAGLAMANLGDIDRQSIAGAISTGTHGTGPTLGNISTQVVALRLVIASGEVVNCSAQQEPELFKAAQVSLGALGVITQVTLQLLPAYPLHEQTWVADFADCTAHLDELIANNRHFEFFWSPGEDACAMKALNPPIILEDGQRVPPRQNLERGLGGEARGRLARYLHSPRTDRSYRIFPSERNLKFNEMEFALPAAHGPDCLRELRQLMQQKHRDVLWPIEYRTLAADDLWLSPAYNRAAVTISIHQAAELLYQDFFGDAEAIFRNHHGRPHWGKMHTHSARDLAALYPQWEHFQTMRTQVDPTGLFLNDYLRTMMEE